MKHFTEYRVILWDFDGVIMDSMPIRDSGFEQVLKDYPTEQVARLLRFHRAQGGLSRFVKFRHFFEDIRGETVSEKQVQELAIRFSKIMLENLINPKYLIEESLNFIKENFQNQKFHIVSGSDEKELNKICSGLNIRSYFKTIKGSPTPKNKLVADIIKKYEYKNKDVCLIGDSINDLEAAQGNDIAFFGFNNPDLKEKSDNYIDSFNSLR
ncbi:HAD family hydrolase [Aequorivita capsosiphonis]|uniref:HAD family hydrolase n=1 Tax=Aequorivita capsosiphonis TaxID=487317 RepID=UPI0004058501|nr:HAD hydrolase-like protein [Aequorivita capsosiphonis]